MTEVCYLEPFLFRVADGSRAALASWRDQSKWEEISRHHAACGDYENLPALEVKKGEGLQQLLKACNHLAIQTRPLSIVYIEMFTSWYFFFFGTVFT